MTIKDLRNRLDALLEAFPEAGEALALASIHENGYNTPVTISGVIAPIAIVNEISSTQTINIYPGKLDI